MIYARPSNEPWGCVGIVAEVSKSLPLPASLHMGGMHREEGGGAALMHVVQQAAPFIARAPAKARPIAFFQTEE